MSKERIRNIVILVFVAIVIFLIGMLWGTRLNKDKPAKEKEDNKVVEVKELTTEEVLASIVGEWGMCKSEYGCNGVYVAKGKDGEYKFSTYIMWSEWGEVGTVKDVEKIDDNKYNFTVYYAGYNNEMGSSPEQTLKYVVDISEVADKYLYVDSDKYQYFTGDRDTFYRSIMS